MGKIIPEKVMYFNASFGEKKVYDCLKKLPDDYIVFYSVAWQQKNRIRQNVTWGESDFTILHPNKGILVIEVKSGGISYKNGEWLQTRLDNNMTKHKYLKKDSTVVEEFKEWKASNVEKNTLYKSITGAMWSVIVIIYFVISFLTMAWHITWIIFLIGSALQGIVHAIFELKK